MAYPVLGGDWLSGSPWGWVAFEPVQMASRAEAGAGLLGVGHAGQLDWGRLLARPDRLVAAWVGTPAWELELPVVLARMA